MVFKKYKAYQKRFIDNNKAVDSSYNFITANPGDRKHDTLNATYV